MWMVCLGFEPRAARNDGWKVQTNQLSYGGLPLRQKQCDQ